MIKKKLLLLICILMLTIPGVVLAQDPPETTTDHFRTDAIPKYNLQFWRPAPNPGDFLTSYGTMIDDDNWRVTGGFYLHYAHIPFEMKYSSKNTNMSVLANQTYLDLYASLSLFKWVEIALSMPVALYESTDFSSESDYPNLSKLDGAAGAGDLRIVVKGKILDLRKYPVGLALIADLSTPTGTKDRFMSDEAVTFALLAALEFNPYSKIRMRLNLGYRYRPHRWHYGKFETGQTFLISGAAAVPFFHKDIDLLLDMHGEFNLEQDDKSLDAKERPFEADLAFRFRFLDGNAWYRGLALTAGIGTGVMGVGSPDVRVFLGLNFHWVNGGVLNYDLDSGGYITAVDPCPDPELTPPSQIPDRCRKKTVDSDGDTIPDADDKCPFTGRVGQIDEFGCPPDRDGDTIPDYQDNCPDEPGLLEYKGCQPSDSDGDTIVDNIDECPSKPETFNGYEDEDGCPDSDPDAKVSLEDGKINIKEQVFFETGKAKIKKESFDLLNQVAKLLNDNPHIGNITVEGHTDSRGKYKSNIKLSQDRADSVMKYLIGQGVDPNRLTAKGYGPDRPIDDNETEEGRAKNRRVEFVVLGLPDDSKK